MVQRQVHIQPFCSCPNWLYRDNVRSAHASGKDGIAPNIRPYIDEQILSLEQVQGECHIVELCQAVVDIPSRPRHSSTDQKSSPLDPVHFMVARVHARPDLPSNHVGCYA